MDLQARSCVGTGIYSVPEASRLTGVSSPRIRRWLRGYRFKSSGYEHESVPVWPPELPEIDGRLALGFRDLLEVRFVDAFLREGVSWPTIRGAAARARDLFEDSHPFSRYGFKTDGRSIFTELAHDGSEKVVLELARKQQYFDQIISPFLRGIEFADEYPVRWWPIGQKNVVVIDPRRSFGQPIVADRGIPTTILARAVEATGSDVEVARWYEVPRRSVQQAVTFEKKLAA